MKEILSVQREDGEIFSIGDKIVCNNTSFTISHIDINDGYKGGVVLSDRSYNYNYCIEEAIKFKPTKK